MAFLLKHKTLQGFTIIETVISMAIGIIIVGFSYLIFREVKNIWFAYNNERKKMLALSFLKTTLDNDFENTIFIKMVNEKEFDFFCKNDTIYYFIDTSVIRIKNSHIDKFGIPVGNLKTTYVQSLEEKRIVKNIAFDVLEPVIIKNVSFYKLYTGNDLMKFRFNHAYYDVP